MHNPSANRPSSDVADDSGEDLHKETVGESIEKSIAGTDAPMEQEHPTSPGAIVWFTYPALLIVALLVALAIMAWWNAASQAVTP